VTPRRHRRRLLAEGTICFLVAASLVYSYATYVRLSLTAPDPTDYDQSTRYIRANWEAGDLIDANPFWATRVREYLGDLPLEALRDPGGEDLTRYRRVWLFSLFGAAGPERVRRAMDDIGALLEERQFGHVNVRLYTVRAHEPVRYDFREALDEARVWIQRGDEERECVAAERGRWRCSRADWNYVGRETVEMGDEPRAVIWAHPVSDGVLTIAFAHAHVGRALVIHAGFATSALGYGGAPVEMTVETDGKVRWRQIYGPDSRFERARIETPDLAGGVHRVTFKVTTLDDRMRHFCFDAETLG
jgi:hypothetical protein